MAKSARNAPVPDSPTPAYVAMRKTVANYCPAPRDDREDFETWWRFSDRNTQVRNPETGKLELIED